MIGVNANYTNLRNNGASIEWRIINGANTITKTNLISGRISAGYMENVSIGNCVSAKLDLTLWGVTVDTTQPLNVQFRADGGTSWYTKGTFYIDTLEKSPYTENIVIVAFDAMLKAEVGYMASGVWANPTDKAVVDDIVSDLGVILDSATSTELTNNPITLTSAPHIGENGTTDRQMLSYIAMLRGGNWIISAGNVLKLRYPSAAPSDTAQVDGAVVNFGASNALTVSKVKVNLDSETYYLAPSNITEDAWKELAGYCIEIDLPFYGSQAVADALLTQYNAKTFIPYTAQTAYVDPKYEVFDGVRFQKDSTYYTTIIANQTIALDPLAASDLYLRDEERLESLYPYLSPRERQTLYQFGELEASVSDATTAANDASAAVGNAAMNVQTIYKSAVSGTTTLAPNTTWVTYAVGDQNTWTTTRPVYDSNYPIMFRAIQTQSVEQSSGQTCSCTEPVIDTTTTIIDGSHIITGTIDATKITAGSLSVGCFDSSVQDSLGNADTALAQATANANELNAMHGYLNYDSYTATLTLGEQNSQFKTQIDNTQMAFLQGNSVVAYISNNMLNIPNAKIEQVLQIGHYQWITDSTGRMSLKWVN